MRLMSRPLWRIRRLCRNWKTLLYIVAAILLLQAFLALNSNTNLLEEEKLMLIKEAQKKKHQKIGHFALQDKLSIVDTGVNEVFGNRSNINAHNPKIRERFIRDAGNYIDILEDNKKRDPVFTSKDKSSVHSKEKAQADYKPNCEVSSKDAISAISRAKTNACKQEIANIACSVQNKTMFASSMPRYCTHDFKYVAQAPIPSSYDKQATVKICYMLVVHGRAVRQFRRLFKVLYHKDHYFYIHVDKRSDHLHREVLEIAKSYPNVEVAPWRMATIWGGSSLLQMLLHALSDVLNLWRDWDFFINLSALDFPIEAHDKLVNYLTTYRDKNFMKSHGRDDEKFIRKQGLNRVFVECEQHMWRLGERDLPKGIILNGGSDWVALNRDYCDYIINGDDQLSKDLKHWYKYTLLPAESFFHTLVQNSLKCETFVDNNLRVTNWNRARGCKCQYKHIVDWCGCSPNDFYPADLVRLQTTRPVFFARKFEESINQEVVNHLDFKLYGDYPPGTPAIRSYWENCYDVIDGPISVNDVLLTHYNSFARLGLANISPRIIDDDQPSAMECNLQLQDLKLVEMYRNKEEFKGYVVTYEATWSKGQKFSRGHTRSKVMLQSLVARNSPLEILDHSSLLASRLEWAAVGTNWDVKELVLRDWGGIIGPLSEPHLVARWANAKDDFIVTVVLIDPLNVVADYNDFRTPAKAAGVTDTPLSLKKPLRPGKWTVKFYVQRQFQKPAAELTFVVAPLQFRDSKADDVSLVTDNRGVIDDNELNSARRNLYSIRTTLNLPQDHGALKSLEERAAYIGEDLESWIDEVVMKAWRVEDTCLAASDANTWTWSLPKDSACLTQQRIIPKLCRNTAWSSLSPDPKSELGPLQTNGRIR